MGEAPKGGGRPQKGEAQEKQTNKQTNKTNKNKNKQTKNQTLFFFFEAKDAVCNQEGGDRGTFTYLHNKVKQATTEEGW